MKKIILIVLILSVVVILLGIAIASLFIINSSNIESTSVIENTTAVVHEQETETLTPALDIMTGYKDITIEIDGTPVKLVNGLAEIDSGSGSATKISIHYFGNEAFGDLNGDGKEDIVYLITVDGGGSGTFFNVVAALQTKTGYEGTNVVYLGDRIAPQSTSISAGEILVNYADRKKDEPFTTQPSIGVSKYLKIQDGKLIESLNLSQITNREWTWISTFMNDGSNMFPKMPDAFRITFQEDGSFIGTTDCNSFFGQVTVENNKLVFGPIGATKMYCEGSQETEFLKSLAEVESFMINAQENQLVFLMKFDSGSITLE